MLPLGFLPPLPGTPDCHGDNKGHPMFTLSYSPAPVLGCSVLGWPFRSCGNRLWPGESGNRRSTAFRGWREPELLFVFRLAMSVKASQRAGGQAGDKPHLPACFLACVSCATSELGPGEGLLSTCAAGAFKSAQGRSGGSQKVRRKQPVPSGFASWVF